MNLTPLTLLTHRRALAALVAGACALAVGGAGAASAQSGDSVAQMTPPPASSGVSATLEQCVTSLVPGERAATFTGEMTAIPGAARMAMRIDVEEREPGEAEFHFVSASGLGVWRWADPKVKVYKYLKQVTNLSSPASYRGLVRFRWVSARGHVIKRAERMTARCLQPAPPPAEGTSSTPISATPPAASG